MVTRSLRTRRCHGLSLIETMAAIAVLTIAAATVTLGGPAHFQTVAASHRQTLAVEALNAALEHARSEDGLSTGETTRALTAEFPGATLTRTVTERKPGLLAVEVSVQWSEGETYPAQLSATTLVARAVR